MVEDSVPSIDPVLQEAARSTLSNSAHPSEYPRDPAGIAAISVIPDPAVFLP